MLDYEGRNVVGSGSPRESLKVAYSVYEFLDEDTWLSMLKSRNDMIHIYNSQAAKQMVDIIVQKYISAFEKLQEEILKIYKYIFNEI
nr:HI0074 family nucleotidyltransferase substrate-binding subunit [Mediterraneibacter hominis]